MARYTQVVRMCENHPDRPAIDPEYPPVTWGDGTPMLFDACEECDTVIVMPFLAMMAKGQRVEGSAKAPQKKTPAKRRPRSEAKEQCPLCPFKSVSREALGSHTRGIHGKTLTELRYTEGATTS